MFDMKELGSDTPTREDGFRMELERKAEDLRLRELRREAYRRYTARGWSDSAAAAAAGYQFHDEWGS